MAWQKLNPATGELLATYQATPSAELDHQVICAYDAFQHWQQSGLKRRQQLLNRFAELLLEHLDALATCITAEVGKPLHEAIQLDIMPAISHVQAIAKQGVAQYRPQDLGMTLSSLMLGRHLQLHRLPHGVMGVISPWNYPIGLAASILANCLMAGNTVVFKPSERTPATGQALVELWHQACQQVGVPTAVVQLVQGDGKQGSELVNHPLVQAVVFTGSDAVGRQIQQVCASRNIPCVLELGGSDAGIILPSASALNMDTIVANVVWSRFSNAGQTCAAIKRLYVHDSLFPVVKELLLAKLLQLNVGDPTLPTTHMGPLIDQHQWQRCEAQRQDAIDKGATVHQATLSSTACSEGYYMPPTLLFETHPDMRVRFEETFGPLLPIMVYQHVDDVIDEINRLPYGLGASVFGATHEAEAVARRLQVGQVGINHLAMLNNAFTQAPWLGWKCSGPGVRGGVLGMESFVKHQVQASVPRFTWPVLAQGKDMWLFGKSLHSFSFAKRLCSALTAPQGWKELLHVEFYQGLWDQRPIAKL